MSIRSKIFGLAAVFVLWCAGSAAAQSATPPTTRDPIPPPLAAPSGLDGAGFINVVDVDPFDASRILVGGDVSGVHWSDDRGGQYHGGNKGLYNSNLLHIADVEFSPTVRGKVFGGAGIKGNSGGFLVSTDSGRTWEVRSTKPQFASDNSQGTGLPSPHPRSTGNLIAADPNGVLYAATFNDGLMRSTDDGRNWQVLGLAGKFLRSLALDPANPDVLYVASYNDGVYVTTTARGAGTFTKMSGSPTTPEELTVVNGNLWLAAGPKGVWKATGTAASRTWSQIPTAQIPLPTADRKVAYQSITGYKPASGPAILYAGNVFGTEATTENGQFNTVYRSDDGGTTWQSVTDIRDNISFNVNKTGDPWWLLEENTSMALGRGTGVASQIEIDPHNPNRIYAAGRSGVWASDNRGDNWFPVVGGLGATIPRGTAAEANTGNMYVAIADWVMVQSSDFGKSFEANKPPGPANVGYGVDVDDGTVPNTVYVAVGERDNPNVDGEVFHNANPTGGGAWVSDGLGSHTGGKRVLNVVTKRIGGRLVILAAVEAGGVWRKEGVNGTWTKATGNALSTSPGRNGPQFAGHIGTGVVYLYDQSKGIFRSTDEGRSFTLIWDEPVSGQFGGYIAVDPVDPGRVYVAQGKTAYRLDGADNGTVSAGIQVTDLKVPNPGPPGVASDGSVWIGRQATETKSSALLRSQNAGATWTELVDPEWEANGGEITDTILGGNTSNLDTMRIYAGFDGTGVLVFDWGGDGGEIPADLAPSTGITRPAPNEVYKQPSVQITGNATDDHAVSFVNVAIQDKATLKWLQPNGTWGATVARLPATVNSPGAKQTSWSFTTSLQPGQYTVHAAAIDNAGFEDENRDWKSFSVSEPTGPGWNFETLDGAGGGSTLNADVGSDNSAILFGGKPHVFYRADGPGNLRHAWWTGTAWGFETLDGAGGGNGRVDGNVGAEPSAMIYNGAPHVWYHDVGADNLRHGWWDGTKWVFETLDGAGGNNGRISGAAGVHASAIMYNAAPHIWYEGGAENLRHGWWDGTKWVFETLDGAGGNNGRIDGSAGLWNSAMLYNGAPHVWYQGGAENLRHGWWDGRGWFFETLDGAGGNNGRVNAAVGESTSAILYQNSPHVWYGDATNGDLRHAWWDGVKWNAETNDGAGAAPSVTNAGAANVAMLFNGQPHVWYRESVGGDLRHAWYDAGWHKETLDGVSGSRGRIAADVGDGPTVLLFNTGPQVWYGDATNGNLRHAWYP